jgi:rod shape-determining protein MreB
MIATEPTAVAIRDGGIQAAVFGDAAFETAAGDPEFRLRRPVAGGEIVDATSARWLVNHAMIRAAGRQRIFKPDVVIAVMSSLPGGQRRSLLESAALAGARTAYLLDAPLAAAMGAGVRLSGPNGHLVVDIGAGKTDIATLALEGTVSGRCLTGHGGMRLHGCVADHVRQEHGVTLEPATVEDVIASLARVGPHEERRLEVMGRGESGEERLTITSTEMNGCLEAHVRPILTAVAAVLSDTPGRLMDDIQREGILLCGGGARLEGLDGAIAAATGIDVHRDTQPELCGVRGTSYALDNLDVLKRTLMYIR